MSKVKYPERAMMYDEFVTILADRADFSKQDVKALFNTLHEVLVDLLVERKSVVIPNLFKFDVIKIPIHKKLDSNIGINDSSSERYVIRFYISTMIKNKFRARGGNKVD